jgi:hypothetical protein
MLSWKVGGDHCRTGMGTANEKAQGAGKKTDQNPDRHLDP